MTCKLLRFILPAAFLTVTALAQTGNAAAAPANGGGGAPSVPAAQARIGIIDIQRAIMATNEGQRDFSTLQKKFEPKQNDLNTLNKEIEDLKKQLQTQGDKLNEDARATMVKNIEAKQKTLQRQVEDAQGDFQSQQNEIANRIGGKMLDVLDKFAKQHGYAVILDVSSQQSPVLWAAETTNVTQEIVTAYNSQSGVPAPAANAGGTPSAPSAARPASARPAGATGTTTTKPPAPKP
jgi:outer membrane protein